MSWLAGDESRREELIDAVARLETGEGVTWLRAREGRRRLARVAMPDGRDGFAKHFFRAERHPFREWWKRWLHLTTPEREWRAMRRLTSLGIPVPAPLAHVSLDGGERVVISEWLEGRPLGDALPTAPAPRRRLLADTGALVRRVHEAGWVHRDLHRENVHVADGTLYLIDLQAARRGASRRARLRDLGRLDFSLRDLLSIGDRVRLRAAALGVSRPFDPAARAALRAVGEASLARGRIHAASRARRGLRPGRRARRFSVSGGHGLVSRDADEELLRNAIAAGGDEHAGVALRHYPARWRDLGSGSAARRAWAVAYALEASDIGCVRPLAFLEWRKFGLPERSLLAVAAPEPLASQSASAVRAPLETKLRQRLAEAGFCAQHLDSTGLFLTRRKGRDEAAVSALEDLVFSAEGVHSASARTVTQR